MAKRQAREAEASDFSRYLRLLDLYKRDGSWDDYLALAMSPRFQQDLAAEAVRAAAAGAGGSLEVLETALGQAVRLRRIGDAAALALAAARWARYLSFVAAQGAVQQEGHAAEVTLRTGRDVLRALLRAWEFHDRGNRGAARALLASVVRGRPPLIRTSDGDDWAVPLLRRALVIDPDAAARLLGLVDDNVLGDLARELTAAGEYAHARTAGAEMRLFHETKADILADLALAQAGAALVAHGRPGEPPDRRTVPEIANLAANAARQAQQEGTGVASQLAKAAAALTLSGEHAHAAGLWAEAMAAVERDRDPADALAEFAQAQVSAGLLDDAARVLVVLLDRNPASLDDWQPSVALNSAWQAAAALVAALAERRDMTGAHAALRMIPDFAHSHPRAVHALARVIAATDVREAERLAGLVDEPDARAWVLAAVASAAWEGGHHDDALRVAGGIEHARPRAQALVDMAAAPGRDVNIPVGEVRDAIEAVTDIDKRAVLLAQLAVTQDSGERGRILADARRLAGQAPADARWRALANVGATAAVSGLTAEALEAFTAAQRLLAKDAREWDFELRQLCQLRLRVGDTSGARETTAVALHALPGRTTAGRRSRRRRSARRPDHAAIAAAEAAQDVPIAVAALAAIAVAIGDSAGPEATEEPGAGRGQIERVLAAAERLATGLQGTGAILADEALAQADIALGRFAAAERRVLSLLPLPDDEADHEIGLVTAARERGIALADALVAAGESENAARLMREIAGRLSPCAWDLGPGAAELLAELAAAQIRAADSQGARTTEEFAVTVAFAMTPALRLPGPPGSPATDETDMVTAVVETMNALMRDSGIGPAEFAGAGVPATDYAIWPWQARARTLAALAGTGADPAARARLAAMLTQEHEQIWRLATVTFVQDVTIDPRDAARALAVLVGAQAGIGELADARQAAARAVEIALDIKDRTEQARTLAEAATSLSAIGDHAAAISTARRIDHRGYEGEAMAAAISAAASASPAAGSTDLEAEARTIKDEGWRAVALAAILIAGTSSHDFTEVDALIGRVAHGNPRDQVWQIIIGQCLAAGQYDLAVGLTDKITGDDGSYQAVLAAALGLKADEDKAAGDALLRLLPSCARHPQAAYGACAALAMAFPADATVIAGAVAQQATATTTTTANHNRD